MFVKSQNLFVFVHFSFVYTFCEFFRVAVNFKIITRHLKYFNLVIIICLSHKLPLDLFYLTDNTVTLSGIGDRRTELEQFY